MTAALGKHLVGWGIAGAATVAGGFFISPPDQHAVPSTAPKAPVTVARKTVPVVPPKGSLAELLAGARRETLPEIAAGELFAGHAAAAAVQPRPSVPGVVPAKVVAPPFPFKYAGWMRGSGTREIYLERANRIIPVKAGDVVDGFRIDSIGDDRMDVTYLAAGQQSTVMFASLAGGTDVAPPAGVSQVASGAGGVQGSQLAAAPAPSSSTPTAGSAVAQAQPLAGGFAPAPVPSAPTAPRGGLIADINAQQSAPPSGSMPTGAAGPTTMPIGPAPSGSFPATAAPSGRLGIESAGAGRLGTEASSNAKLGL